jgi:hypothetical protein
VGGLNVPDIKAYLLENKLDSTGTRKILEQRLKKLIETQHEPYFKIVNKLEDYEGDKLLLCGGHKSSQKPAYNSTGWYTINTEVDIFPDLIGVLPGGYEDIGDPIVSEYLSSKKFSMVFNEFCGPGNLVSFASCVLKPGGIYYSPAYYTSTEKYILDAGFREVIYMNKNVLD